MSIVPASIRKAGARATLALPFRIPPQDFFTLRQAGAVLGLSETSVETLYDNGKLTGHTHAISGEGQRKHKRVLRASLVAYAQSTADYTDDSFCDALVAMLPHLPAPSRARVMVELRRIES